MHVGNPAPAPVNGYQDFNYQKVTEVKDGQIRTGDSDFNCAFADVYYPEIKKEDGKTCLFLCYRDNRMGFPHHVTHYFYLTKETWAQAEDQPKEVLELIKKLSNKK
jgi:hypothetical protein